MTKYVVPLIGRAGLGNELFPVLRAVDLARRDGGIVLWPSWVQIKVGPILRRERDKRLYWRIFRAPKLSVLARRLVARVGNTVGVGRTRDEYTLVKGMDNFFADVRVSGPEFREAILNETRPSAVSHPLAITYVAVHVRLGDFARPDAQTSHLTSNNISSPISWFVSMVVAIRADYPDTQVFVCSDGEDEELEPLLSIGGVQRSNGLNALDDLLFLSRAAGIVGSRSTFSAWGAFLGAVPLVVQSGGNAYKPHGLVWEADSVEAANSWRLSVAERLVRTSSA